jgi:geranylgeranyl diphosphate synthase, type II
MDKRADVFAPLAQVDQRISDLLEKVLEPGSLREACIYAVVGGGKRVRPMLCWHACVAVGGDGSRTLDVGAALELIHAFSLVHDDLPALDDDDLRRGKPTLHRYAGEAMAILAGDALLSAAFGVVTDAPMIPAATRLMLVRRLAAATCSMVQGQVHDTLGGMELESLEPRARLETIHRAKTGALIHAACVMGAACAPEASPASVEAVDEYGRAVGLLFQIVDDILDVEQPESVAGKRTGKDAEAGKVTYPVVLGLAGAKAAAAATLESALGCLKILGPRAEGLADLANLIARRTH